MLLSGKTLIVSGAGPGLGREVARCALRDGARVVLGARDAAKLDALSQALDPSGERAAAHAFDLADPAGCDDLVAFAERRFGGVDALVQVAALDTVFGGLDAATPEDFRRVMEVNVVGSTRLCRAVAPALRRRGGGSIVLIGSQSALLATSGKMLAYAASKGALLSAMVQMAAELGPDRIRVNTVVPTWMWGPAVQGFVARQAGQRGVAPELVKAELVRRFPLGEIPADDDVAEVAVLFCSDRMRMVSGQALRIDGGESLL